MFNLKKIRKEYSSLPYKSITKHHYIPISHGKLNPNCRQKLQVMDKISTKRGDK